MDLHEEISCPCCAVSKQEFYNYNDGYLHKLTALNQ